ncbi:MAG TPA: hypothetical protein VM554_06350 [Acidisarcina sp.]|nr:hypothetical protein [Acidisarcina sp.]
MQDTLIAITAITSIGIFIQACVLIGIFLGTRKAIAEVTRLLDELKEHILPALATTRHLLEDVSPKIKVMATNFTEVSHTVRHQTEHVNAAVDEMVDRTRHQAERMDNMVSGTLDGLHHATVSLQEGIAIPVRKVQGLFQGFRAGLETLLQRDHAPGDHSKNGGNPVL